SEMGGRLKAVKETAEELKDIRNHWAEWRAEWERKLQQNEIQYLRSTADLQGHFTHRVNVLDSNYRETIRLQHNAFTAELGQKTDEIQKRLWVDLEKIRLDYERLIFSELKTIRQRSLLTPPPTPAATPAPPMELPFDYGRFAERFRGTEEYVKSNQQLYRPLFTGKSNV